MDGADFEESPDDVTLLQQYITPADPFITRVELVGGVFQYAIRSSTQDGFELCTTVECQPGDLQCPAADTGKFTLHEDLTASDRLVRRYAALMRAFHIDIAGIEFVEDRDGVRYTYDINLRLPDRGRPTRPGTDGIGVLGSSELGASREVDVLLAGPAVRLHHERFTTEPDHQAQIITEATVPDRRLLRGDAHVGRPGHPTVRRASVDENDVAGA